jgi:hypothetical protein
MDYRNHTMFDGNGIKDVFDRQWYRELIGQQVIIDGENLAHNYFSEPRDIALGFALDGCYEQFGTRNADNDGGPSGPRRHGLKLVRWSEKWMSEWMPEQTSELSWMTRVRIVMWTRMEVRTGSEGVGSDL